VSTEGWDAGTPSLSASQSLENAGICIHLLPAQIAKIIDLSIILNTRMGCVDKDEITLGVFVCG
jgi:hypothetical protein